MTTTWYPISLVCSVCTADMALTQAQYSADGELRWLFACPKCANVLAWRVFASALAHTAMANDIERHIAGKVKPQRTVQPPLLAAGKPMMTDADKQFEKAIGIVPEDLP